MNARPAPSALLASALLVLAGCLGAPTASTTPGAGTSADQTPITRTATDSPGTNAETAPTTPAGRPVTDYEVYVFDHGGIESASFEGGITHASDGEYDTRYYVTAATSADDASRFNHSVLSPNASTFVRETSFENASLVVIQAFPASSHPDYRVEKVRRADGTVHVAINDSSYGATADITVETVLVRVPGEHPERVQVTTEEGDAFDTTDGIVTPQSTPTPELTDGPLSDVDDSKRLADAGGLRVENRGGSTNGYRLTLSYHHSPDCLDETPACGQPTRTVDVLDRREKLRPGANRTLAGVAEYQGDYTVTVEAELPANDGSRTTVTESFEWPVHASGVEAVVTITDDDVSFRTSE